jgi:hypothetical protein
VENTDAAKISMNNGYTDEANGKSMNGENEDFAG